MANNMDEYVHQSRQEWENDEDASSVVDIPTATLPRGQGQGPRDASSRIPSAGLNRPTATRSLPSRGPILRSGAPSSQGQEPHQPASRGQKSDRGQSSRGRKTGHGQQAFRGQQASRGRQPNRGQQPPHEHNPFAPQQSRPALHAGLNSDQNMDELLVSPSVKDEAKSKPSSAFAKQLHLSRRKKEKVEKMAEETAFLKTKDLSEFKYTGGFIWSEDDPSPDTALGDKLRIVEIERKVRVVYDSQLQVLLIKTNDFEQIEVVIQRIQELRKAYEVEMRTFPTLYMIDPPSSIAMREHVSARLKEGGNENKLVVRRVRLVGSCLYGSMIPAWEAKRAQLLEANEKRLQQHLKFTFKNICSLQSSMRMRLHFGYIELKDYRKDLAEIGLTYDAFAKMMTEKRTVANLEKRLGNLQLAHKVLTQIHRHPDRFLPVDAMAESLKDIQPYHIMIIIVNQCDNIPKSYRLEVQLDRRPDGKYQAGTMACFEEQTALISHSKLACLGFERHFDWGIDILTKKMVAKIPKVFQNLVYQKATAEMEFTTDSFGHPQPVLSNFSTQTSVEVKEIHVRTSLHYKLSGTQYLMNVDLHRDLTHTSPNPGSCGINLYCLDWDSRLGQKDGLGCQMVELGSNLEKLFPRADSQNGFVHFLQLVRDTQQFLCAADIVAAGEDLEALGIPER